MKIKCPYCGNMFNDTLTNCPSCGAANEAVVRTSSSQPLTIEQLKQWYADRGLPPAETTRFFIGENYKGARAFGIYKDQKTGNYVVYKNKDNGNRAIRYEGTDEAYAVNELYQRLKEEIIQQKQHNLVKKTADQSVRVSPAKSNSTKSIFNPLGTLFSGLLLAFGVVGGLIGSVVLVILIGFAMIVVIGMAVIFVEDAPKDGYYQYQQAYYYHYDFSEPEGKTDWFLYDTSSGEWRGPIAKGERPEELEKNKKAKKYFLSVELPSELKGESFTDSLAYKDVLAGNTRQGYYEYEDTTYYYQDYSDQYGWYYYDYDRLSWYETEPELVPEDLTHSSIAQDFYFTPTWDSSTQFTDFTDSPYYVEDKKVNDDSKWENDDDDSDFDWDSDDSWSSDDTDWDSDW